jgi:hypothetical protein
MNQTPVAQRLFHTWLLLSALFFALNWSGPVAASEETRTAESTRGVEIQPQLAEGLPIGLVYIYLEKSTGDPAKDEAFKKEVAAAFAIGESETFRRIVVDFGLKRVRQLDSVQSAELRVFETVPSGRVVVAVLVVPIEAGAITPKKPKGMLPSSDIRDFPTIFENDRSRFVFILNGGVGVFSDTDPWFGGYGELFNRNNPTAEDPLGPGTSTWVEGYIEPGFGGILQFSNYPLYPYGAVSYLMSGTDGHDIYNSGSRGSMETSRSFMQG